MARKSNLGPYLTLVINAFKNGGPKKYLRMIETKGAIKGGIVVIGIVAAGKLIHVALKKIKPKLVHRKRLKAPGSIDQK